jgi:hypothetical protein
MKIYFRHQGAENPDMDYLIFVRLPCYYKQCRPHECLNGFLPEAGFACSEQWGVEFNCAEVYPINRETTNSI